MGIRKIKDGGRIQDGRRSEIITADVAGTHTEFRADRTDRTGVMRVSENKFQKKNSGKKKQQVQVKIQKKKFKFKCNLLIAQDEWRTPLTRELSRDFAQTWRLKQCRTSNTDVLRYKTTIYDKTYSRGIYPGRFPMCG